MAMTFRTFFLTLACVALATAPGCNDSDDDDAAVVNPGPDPSPTPGPDPTPDPDPEPLPPEPVPGPGWQLQMHNLPDLGVTAVDADHIWISNGSSIQRSSDGGATWTELGHQGADSAGGLTFVSVTEGWMLTEAGVYTTSNGGESWTLRSEPPSPSFAESFPSASTAWIGDYYGETYFRTTDGGLSWTSVEVPEGISPQLKFFDAENGLVSLMRTDGRMIFATRDGGATWDEILNIDMDSHIATFDATDMDHIWAGIYHNAGSPSHVLRTSNGGATWESVELPAQSIGDVDFVDAAHGWITTTFAVFHSEDGGATWTAQETPEIPGGPYVYFGFSGLVFVSPTTGWMTGSNGQTVSGMTRFLMKTTNGGE